MVVAFLLAAFLIGYTLSQSNPPTPDAETHNQNDIEDVEAKSKEQANIPHFVDPQPAASLANISNGLATQNANLQKERDAAAILKIKQDQEAVALLEQKRALQLEEDKQEAQTAYTLRLEQFKRERACMKQKAAMLLKQGNVIGQTSTNPTLGPQTREVPIQKTKDAIQAATQEADEAYIDTGKQIAKLEALEKQKVLEEEAAHEELNAGLASRPTPKVANHTTWHYDPDGDN